MNAVLGVGLLAASVLLFAWTYGHFRRPQPKAWAKSDFAATATTLMITCLFAFALVFLGDFLVNLGAESRWLETIAMVGGAFLVCRFLIPRLMGPALQGADVPTALDSPTTDTLPEPANDPRPTSPARSGRQGGKPSKRRAA